MDDPLFVAVAAVPAVISYVDIALNDLDVTFIVTLAAATLIGAAAAWFQFVANCHRTKKKSPLLFCINM